MGISPISLQKPQVPPNSQSHKAKQKLLLISISIFVSYTLYDTYLGQQYLASSWDKLKRVVFLKKVPLGESNDATQQALDKSLNFSFFSENITSDLHCSLPDNNGRRQGLEELNERAARVLSEAKSEIYTPITPYHLEAIIENLFQILQLASFLLELPLFFKLIYQDLGSKKKPLTPLPYHMTSHTTKQIFQWLLTYLEKQGLQSWTHNRICIGINRLVSYPLKSLNKDEKKLLLNILSISIPLTVIYLLYSRKNNYNKGLKKLSSAASSPFPLPEEKLPIKEPSHLNGSKEIGEFLQGKKEKLATLSFPSKEYLHSLLHSLLRLDISKKALGLKEEQAFFYLELDSNNKQATFDKCLKALEESICEHPILILDKENIEIFLQKNEGEKLLKNFFEKINNNKDCKQVKVLIILEDSKKSEKEEINSIFASFSPSSTSLKIQYNLKDIALYNLQQTLSNNPYFPVEATTEELQEFWQKSYREDTDYVSSLEAAQSELNKMVKKYLAEVASHNVNVNTEYLKWLEIKKKINRVKKQLARLTVEMVNCYGKVDLQKKKEVFDLLEKRNFKKLSSDFLVLEMALVKLMHRHKEYSNNLISQPTPKSFGEYLTQK